MRKRESSSKTSALTNPATGPQTGHKNEPHEVTSDWLRIAEGAANAGFYDWDIRTDQITWSEGIYHLFGLPPDAEPSFATWLTTMHPDDIEPTLARIQESIAKRISISNEYRVFLPDGSERWINTLGNTFYDEAGKPLRHSGICVDITARKEMEEELRESEERLRLAHKATSDVVWDWDIVHDTQRWSEAGAAVFGWTEIVEGPVNAHWWVERVHPGDREQVNEKFFAVVNDPQADHWSDEYRFLKADGSYADVMDRGYLLRDAQGKAVRMIGAMLDITSRKQMEEELARRRAELQSLFDSSNVGLVLFEAKHPYTVITHNRFYQELFPEPYRTVGMAGRNIYEYAPNVEAQGIGAVFDKVVRTGKAVELLDFPYDSNPPERSWFNWHLSPIIHEGKVVALASLSIDVTSQHLAEEQLRRIHDDLERRIQERTGELEQTYRDLIGEMEQRNRLEEQLRQAHKMEAIGTLAGGIAHDFNNILAAIIGFTEMAIDDVPDRPLVQKNLQKVMTSATRARELVKQILAFSQKTSYERGPVSLTPIVRETVQLLRASIPATIDVTFSATAGSDTLIASPVEVQRVVMNLATNALLAMEDRRGSLEIALSDTNFEPDASALDGTLREYVQIMVRDTGVGMAPEVMKRVFEPFFTTREVGRGSGMGLAVVYGIVKDLGGTVAVESEPGAGSTFRVFLPKAEAEVVEKTEQVGLPGGTERVLFVDDEPMLLEWGTDTLERLGYTVTPVPDGGQALEIFSADPSLFDIVITDQAMPHMPGSDLCKELLRIRKDIPIILCTGHSETVSPEKARAIGIREFLMKPVKRQELASVVRMVLDGDIGK